MKRILRYARMGLNVAADELEDKGSPKALRPAKQMRALDEAIQAYLSSDELKQ